jgi:hypothetical protein
LSPVLVGEYSGSGLVRFTPGEGIFSYDLLIDNYAVNAFLGVDAPIHVFLTPVLVG